MRTYLLCASLFCLIRYIESQGIFDVFGVKIIDYPNYFSSTSDDIQINTDSPYDIESETSIPVDVPPLYSVVDYTEKLVLKNDGYIVYAEHLDSKSSSYVTGGILGNNIYQYQQTRFFFNNDHTKNAGITLDGGGAPLQIVAQFFKKEYQTFENAYKNYRDGIYNIIVNVAVEGNIANKEFSEFESLLYQITKPNSSIPTTSDVISRWWVRNNPKANYFTGYGSYTDYPSQKTYYTSFGSYLGSGVQTSISIFQFNAFRQLLNNGHAPLNPSPGTFPQGYNRVILHAQGVTVKVLNGPPAEEDCVRAVL